MTGILTEFHCSRLGFEPTWMTDQRKWSCSDFILWLKMSQTCSLKCEHCHEYNSGDNSWLNVDALEDILKNIHGKVHISPSLGDILLSPYRYDIFDSLKQRGNIINLFSYIPEYVDLTELGDIMDTYNFPVCWSLHGENDDVRALRFEKPHKIHDVLLILNKPRKTINRIYIFANKINRQNIGEYTKLLNRLNPDSCEIALTYLIDYTINVVQDIENVKLPIKHKTVIPNLDILFAIYRRRFTYESNSRKTKGEIRKASDCQGG